MSRTYALTTNVTLPVRLWLVTVVLAGTSLDAAAQSFLCDTVRRGDTASSIAWRFTGRAENHQQPWFRILDPVRSKVVPKGAYDRILTGWRACVPATRLAQTATTDLRSLTTTPYLASPVVAARAVMTGAPASPLDVRELAFVTLGVILLGAALGVAWQRAQESVRIRQSLKREVHFFGHLFVKNFERPLVIEGVAAHPIHARLRWVAYRRRLDILLAPAEGRRYPNLYDHRRNVEYDVERIANRLRHHPFVRRPLRAEGQWVVVPFQLKPRAPTGGQV